MRTRTKQEIMLGYAKLRTEKSRKRILPFKILAVVLILGAGVKLILDHRNRLTAELHSVHDTASRWLDDIRDPKHYASKRQDAPPPDVSVTTPTPTPVPIPTPVPTQTPSAGRPSLVQNAWRVSGTVYDLMTLAPVTGATITFLKNEKVSAIATTSMAGTYTIDLAKGNDWTVHLTSPQHRKGQLLDVEPPYRDRDAGARRATIEAITDEDLAASHVGWEFSSSKVKLNLIAVPR